MIGDEELMQASKQHGARTFTIQMSVADSICLIATVQLACRHPEFNGPTRQVSELMARDMIATLMAISPGFALLDAGWDPQHDTVVVKG